MKIEAYEMGVRHRAAGDQYSDSIDQLQAQDDVPAHPLDSAESKKTHIKLLDWFFHERSKQAENRMQMAMDADFYDGEQWDRTDAEVLKDRGQVPLVFNEIAPMVDWLIGTERRTRVDWKVLPRTEDDVQAADAKTKVLKYISDLNRVPFTRSRAFADAIKVGIGWMDDGARDDPTQDVLYSKYEDWRNVLWDSSAYEMDLSDARYLFRWRWVDEDIALMMFPERKNEISRAVIDAGAAPEGEIDQDWYMGSPISQSGQLYASGGGVTGEASRRRIRLIECQYRTPTSVRVVTDGPMKGAHVNEGDTALAQTIEATQSSVTEKVMMRTHFSVFTENSMLAMGASTYRHNRFSLTPIWCYRRGRDRLPYGAIRRIRDIQQDLNKRASKALFLLSTNQIIATKGAVDDKNVARDEADRPDGYIETNAGKEFKIQRDTDAADGQLQMMTMDASSIQRSSGVNNENLGRATNAVSGEAIKARQFQGSVSTTEPFDNLRFAVQVQGEKQVSLSEQFYTEEKVIRLTGTKGKLEWLKINTPELQPDGTTRYLNDISSSMADFIVSEQDYAGTLRQVMFDGISSMAQRMQPDVAIRLFIIAMEFSDLPNKDEIAQAFRAIIGERDPDKEMTPEEMQQQQDQMAQQAEAVKMQQEAASLALEEQRATVDKLNAEAEEIRARLGDGGMQPGQDQAIRAIQEEATSKLEGMADQLRKVQVEAANKTMAINREADTKIEIARIDSDSRIRVAEISAAASSKIDNLEARLLAISNALQKMPEVPQTTK